MTGPNRFGRRSLWAAAALLAATLFTMVPLKPAAADNDGWGHHGYWRGGGWGQPYYRSSGSVYFYSAPSYGYYPPTYYQPYYGPPPVYYAPPPAYYGPPSLGFGVTIPFH
jgi:hypothetical protein